jgi:hypothetical protein
MKTKLEIALKNLNKKTQANWYVENGMVRINSAWRSEGSDYDVEIDKNGQYKVTATGIELTFSNVKNLCSQLRSWIAVDQESVA